MEGGIFCLAPLQKKPKRTLLLNLQSHTSTGLIMILTWNPLANCYGHPHHLQQHHSHLQQHQQQLQQQQNCDFAKEPGKVKIQKKSINQMDFCEISRFVQKSDDVN